MGVVKLFCDKCIIDFGGNYGTTKKIKNSQLVYDNKIINNKI